MTRTSPSERGSESVETATEPDGGQPAQGVVSEPSWLPLAADERIRWRGGPRIQTVLPWVAFALVGTTVLVAAIAVDALPILAAVGLPIAVAPALWQYARVSRTAFVVTNAVAATRHGVFGRTVRTVSLERIQNTTVEQDPIGRIVGYGTVTLETASGTEIRFWNVEDPGRVRDRLEAERERLTGAEIPGGRDQWDTVLDEVRAWRQRLERP
ncbi:PH domain-containing protein [Natrinema salaciae]|uniref:Membrane protein YdbS, contains bPH2 (Pleckstrin homology) domain n=1 Tax=Natrinema salaciae TaxID=1186196 RepID=A0A1H9GEF8_9EURY|nr:PH domain-containing protein [Natrinema salaciae]SEQ48480.1 membrane protein YdbS, contains bPH2 (pleckstrin homology) domain [Natrinema salaciae]